MSGSDSYYGGVLGLHVYGVDVAGYAPMALFIGTDVQRKALFLSPRKSDKASLTASSSTPSLPVENIQNQDPSKVFRTASNVDEYIDFTFFGESIAVNAMAFTWPQGIFSKYAECRLIAYATNDDRTNDVRVLDTNWVSVWPLGFKHSSEDWGPEVGLVQIENEAKHPYWRAMFTDPDSEFDYIDLSRVAMGRATQFNINPGYDGGISFVPLDIQEPNGYGQIFTKGRLIQQRAFELVWSALARLTVTQDAMELTRLRGQAGDLYVFLNPGEVTNFHLFSMQALFEGQTRYVPQRVSVIDKDGVSRFAWGFTMDLIQKL